MRNSCCRLKPVVQEDAAAGHPQHPQGGAGSDPGGYGQSGEAHSLPFDHITSELRASCQLASCLDGAGLLMIMLGLQALEQVEVLRTDRVARAQYEEVRELLRQSELALKGETQFKFARTAVV